MKDLTFETMLAVFQEMFGTWLFWAMVAAVAVVTLGYLYVLIRDRAVSWRKFLLAQISMPFGAVGAVWFVLWRTESRLADIGGPIDVILLLGIALLGAVGLAILVYTVQSLVAPPDAPEEI
jgi:NADH:ubiquinone oxidoreductase subunit 3 (subunit A)